MNNQTFQEKDINLTKQKLIKLYLQYKIACTNSLSFNYLNLIQEEIEKKVIFDNTLDHLKYILIEKEQEEEIEKLKTEITEAYDNFNDTNNISRIQLIPLYLEQIKFSLEKYEKFPIHIQMKGFQDWNISDNKALISLKIKVEKLYLSSKLQDHDRTPAEKKRL